MIRAAGLRLLAALALGVLLTLSAGVVLDRCFPPDLHRLRETGRMVLDAEGRLLALTPAAGGVWCLPGDPARVSPLLIAMLIAVEDRRFAAHPGVDPSAIARAAWQGLRAGHVVSGGSTLTMQVARLLTPRPRTLRSKVIEALRALQLSAHFDKRQILGMWLTLAPFGGNLVGVEAAAHAYFATSPARLDAAQAALLVALPRRPEALRPDRHAEAAQRLRARILRAARVAGLLSPAETEAALATPLPIRRAPMPNAAAPLLARLEAGASPILATTLDAPLQQALTQLAGRHLAALPPRVSLAIAIADADSGALRAVVGGDWGNTARAGWLDLTRARRSPGSTLKPFLYGLALQDGLIGPDSLFEDAPERFGGYAPEDFSHRFIGRVSAADALRQSLNLPAIQLLGRYGALRFIAALRAAGVRPVLPGTALPGLPVILGGLGMSMRELLGLYTALATDGRVRAPYLLGTPGIPLRLLAPSAASGIADILTRPLTEGGPAGIAWKTGTSWGNRDAWAFGFDRAHVIGVWVGRPDGSAMGEASGGGLAVPILAQVFALLPPAPRPMAAAPAYLALQAPPQGFPLRLLFPPPDAVIQGTGAIALRAMGGTRPLAFLVDGVPVVSDQALRQTAWTPPGPGFYRITVLDAAGAAARAAIRVRDEDVTP